MRGRTLRTAFFLAPRLKRTDAAMGLGICRLCANGQLHRHLEGGGVELVVPETHDVLPKPGEHWRKHNHLALEVGANQVQAMDEHYRKHGILVGHRKKKDGMGYEPACVSKRDFDRCLAARGLKDFG